LSERGWSLTTHLDTDLPALLDRVRALSADPDRAVHVIGHSMGGMLAIAALARPELRIASVTAFATPLSLGKHSPLVRLAALVAAPALKRAAMVPMHLFFRAFASRLIAREKRALFDLLALASARTADADLLAGILASSEQESALVLGELAEMAIRGRAVIAGVDLVETARAAVVPISFVFGTKDILAPRASVAGLETGAGPRMFVEIEDALHVDLVVGRHAAQLVAKIWEFLFPR
jgi:pimeloyl-ACP methyl ester carboxylesterase